MIRADEAFGVAGACSNERRAAVAAGVQVATECAVRPAHHEYRLAADVRREKVAGIADMRLMAEEDPVGLEDVAIFGLQDIRIVVDRAIDPKHAILGPIIDIVGKAAPVRNRAIYCHAVQFTFTPAALPTSTHFLFCAAM